MDACLENKERKKERYLKKEKLQKNCPNLIRTHDDEFLVLYNLSFHNRHSQVICTVKPL